MRKTESSSKKESRELRRDLKVAERTLEIFADYVFECADSHDDSSVKRILSDDTEIKRLINRSKKEAECENSN